MSINLTAPGPRKELAKFHGQRDYFFLVSRIDICEYRKERMKGVIIFNFMKQDKLLLT